MSDQEALHDALYTVIRAEIDDSMAFIHGRKIPPRRQRRPRVRPAVRDYIADQIAWKMTEIIDASSGEKAASGES